MWLLLALVLIVVIIAAAAKSLGNHAENPQQLRRNPSNSPRNRIRAPQFRSDAEDRAFVSLASLVEPATSVELSDIKWFGRGTTLRIQGFEIPDPLTYTGRACPRWGERAVDPSQLNPDLPVARAASAAGLPYWPWYSQLQPDQRYVYLTWLVSDRRSLPPTDGYLFLYYYGLERRVIVDGADQALVFAEVFRLRKMHATHSARGPRGSFQNYGTAFLWYLIARFANSVNVEAIQKVVESTAIWSEDTLLLALSWFASRSIPLPSWMAFAVADRSSLSQRSVVVRRAESEFKALFQRKYESAYNQGISLRPSKRETAITYRPASAALSVQEVRVANVLGMNECNRQLSAIWNDCVGELRKFSSVVHKGQPDGELSVAAWEAMPEALRTSTEHPLAGQIHALLTRNATDFGEVLVTVEELASIIGDDQGTRLTIGASRRLADTMQHAGFAIEPDARLVGKSYSHEDSIAIFPLVYIGEPDPGRYGAAACILRLGIAIAEADGKIDDDEIHRIMEQIETGFQLNDHERRRIEALKAVLLNSGADISGLGRKIQSVMSIESRQGVGRLLVAVAGIDGVISKGEISALRKSFRALGLSAELLETTIAELSPNSSDDPVIVQIGTARNRGESIPAPPMTEGVVLDRARVQQIMSESREVSSLLADAMNLDSAEQSSILSPTPGVSSAMMPAESVAQSNNTDEVTSMETSLASKSGIPPRFASFFRALTARTNWPTAEVDALARSHGHMLAGALEAINDWAFEQVGVPLLHEEQQGIVLDEQILAEVKRP